MAHSSSILMILQDMNNALIMMNTDLGEVAGLPLDYGIFLIMFRTFMKLKRFCLSIFPSKIGAGMLYHCNVPAPIISTSNRISHSKFDYYKGGDS